MIFLFWVKLSWIDPSRNIIDVSKKISNYVKTP
jgi:hypothetical protein